MLDVEGETIAMYKGWESESCEGLGPIYMRCYLDLHHVGKSRSEPFCFRNVFINGVE